MLSFELDASTEESLRFIDAFAFVLRESLGKP